MWPWSTIKTLRAELQRAQQRVDVLERGQFTQEALYRTYAYEIRAAHKGIRRLVDKLKRAQQKKEA